MIPRQPGTNQHALNHTKSSVDQHTSYYILPINEFVGYSWAERVLLLSIARNYNNTRLFLHPFEIPAFITEGQYTDGIGSNGRVQVRLPVLEKLLARAA